jgi:UrcA family protein
MNISIERFLGALVLSTLSIGAHADGSSADSSIQGRSVVHFPDLNIESAQDARILLQRIDRAAEEVCGGQSAYKTFMVAADFTFEGCRSGTIARAVKKLGAPQVTRLYLEASRSGHTAHALNAK